MLRNSWVFVLVLIVGGACAGASSPSESATISFDVTGPFSSEQVVAGLLETIPGDPDVAGVAVLSAVDRGYDGALVFGAGVAGRLTAEGFVLADDASVLVPEGSDAGVIVDKTPLPVDAEAAGPAIDLVLAFYGQREPIKNVTAAELGDFLRESGGGDGGIEDAGNHTLRKIVQQLGRGFSIEQIVTAFVLGVNEDCETGELDRLEFCTMAGERPAGPEIQALKRDGTESFGFGTGTKDSFEQSQAEPNDDAPATRNVDDDDTFEAEPQLTIDELPEAALADGTYGGSLAVDYGFLGWASKIGYFDDDSEVMINEATLVIAGGSLGDFEASVLTVGTCCLQLGPGAVDYNDEFSFFLSADPATAVVEAGTITVSVEVDASRRFSGPDAADQLDKVWDRITIATARITTVDGAASVSLLNEYGLPMVSLLESQS